MAKKVGDMYAELKLKKDKFEKNLKSSQKNIKSFRKIAQNSFGMIKGAIAAVGAAMIAIVIKSAKMAAAFDKNMREVNTLARLGEKQFKDLEKAVISLSNRLGKDSTEMAEALYQIVSAGYSGNEAMQLLETGTQMAIGGVAEQKESVDALTTIMNAYSKSVGESNRIGDTFFQSIKYGKTTMTELASTIGNVATPAALAGVSFEELSAAVSALTIVGVKTDKAMIGLRQLLMGVIKPAAESKQAAAEMGIQFDLAALKSKGLAGFLKSVTAATGGSTEKMAKLFPNVRAITALLPLTTNASGKFADILNKMTTESGALNEAFVEMNKSAARQHEIAKTKTSNIMKKLGTSILPAYTASLEGAIPAMDAITVLMGDMQKEGEGLAPLFKGFGEWIGKTSIIFMRFVNNARELMTDFGAHITNITADTLEAMAKIPGVGKGFRGLAHDVRMLNQGFVEQGIALQENEDEYNQAINNLGKIKQGVEEIIAAKPPGAPPDALLPPVFPEDKGTGISKEEQAAWDAEANLISERYKLQEEMHEWAVNYKKDQEKIKINTEAIMDATGEMFGTMIKSGGDAGAIVKRLIGQLIRMTLLQSIPGGGFLGGIMSAFGMQEGGMVQGMPVMNMRPNLAVANETSTPELVVPLDKFKDLIQVHVNGAATADMFLDASKLPDDVKTQFARDVVKPGMASDRR